MHETTRDTLVRTVLDLSSIVGFRQLTVQQVCEASRVATRTFYRSFPDLEAIFAEGYRRLDDDLAAAVIEAYRAHVEPEACARACVDAGLAFVARDQLTAEAFFVHGFEAGPRVAEMRARRIAWMQDLVVARLAHAMPQPLSPSRAFAVELAVGGVLSVIYRCVRDARIDMLATSRDLLVDTLLRPFSDRPDPALARRLLTRQVA